MSALIVFTAVLAVVAARSTDEGMIDIRGPNYDLYCTHVKDPTSQYVNQILLAGLLGEHIVCLLDGDKCRTFDEDNFFECADVRERLEAPKKVALDQFKPCSPSAEIRAESWCYTERYGRQCDVDVELRYQLPHNVDEVTPDSKESCLGHWGVTDDWVHPTRNWGDWRRCYDADRDECYADKHSYEMFSCYLYDDDQESACCYLENTEENGWPCLLSGAGTDYLPACIRDPSRPDSFIIPKPEGRESWDMCQNKWDD